MVIADSAKPADHCSSTALTELGISISAGAFSPEIEGLHTLNNNYPLGKEVWLSCNQPNEQFRPDLSQKGIIPKYINAVCVPYNTMYPSAPNVAAKTWSLGFYGAPGTSGTPCVRVNGCDVDALETRGLKVIHALGDESRPNVYTLDSNVTVRCHNQDEHFGPDREGSFRATRTTLVMKCINNGASHEYAWDLLIQGYTSAAKCDTQPSKCNTQPSKCNTQPSECNTEPSKCNTEPIKCNTQPSKCNTQPRKCNTQPSKCNTQPS